MKALNSFCDSNKSNLQNNIKDIISNSKVRYFLIVLLIPFLMISGIDDALAARKKSKRKSSRARRTKVYNPAKTKANAIATLQTSDQLSKLANIDSNVTHPESKAYITNDADATKVAPAIDSAGMSDVAKLKTFLAEDTELVGDLGEDASELAAEDDVHADIDLTDFKSVWLLAIGATDKLTTAYGTEKEIIMDEIVDWLGTPYRFGGETEKAIDCSAWVRAIFHKSSSIELPRTAREQIKVGHKIKRDNLEFGDLVFFYTYSKKFASHVGIYLDDNLFAHASSVAGVTVSSLNSTFYAKRFIEGRRMSSKDLLTYKIESSNSNGNN